MREGNIIKHLEDKKAQFERDSMNTPSFGTAWMLRGRAEGIQLFLEMFREGHKQDKLEPLLNDIRDWCESSAKRGVD